MNLVAKEYWQLDAFTDTPLKGNAAAVIFDAGDLAKCQMQAIARETNLSETVFLVPPLDPAADFAARIFTPRNEIAFGGHPALAAAYAVAVRRWPQALVAGAALTMECGIGLVRIEVVDPQGPSLSVRQASPVFLPAGLSAEKVARLIGLAPEELGCTAPEIVSTGVRWLIVPVATKAGVAAIQPVLDAISEVSRNLEVDGVIAFAIGGAEEEVLVKLRTFAPVQGIAEDAVCGSGNGSVASYIHKHGLVTHSGSLRYRAEQGAELSRPGRIEVELQQSGDDIVVKVGGAVAVAAKGTLFIPPARWSS